MSVAIEIKVNPDPERARKALLSMASSGYLQVWEGAVRSSKTVIALMAFSLYVRSSKETRFLITGRTVATIEQNCILNDYGLLNMIPGSKYGHFGEKKAVLFDSKQEDGSIVRKAIIVQGASTIKDFMALRGQSYGGWFADEINMHDREFVTEALKRTAASRDRRHFWTLNPGGPKDWIYTDYLDRYESMTDEERERLGGYSWWHFTPQDNPAMTETMLAALEMQYPKGSMSYDRYILGKRALAEGLVFPFFDESCIREPPKDLRVRYAGIDFGTVHPTAMGWYGRDKQTGVWWKVREWVASPEESARMTTADYMDIFERITEELGGIPKMNLTIDYGGGGEALAREAEKRRWMPVNPDKTVLDGIATMARLLSTHRLYISPECTDTIQAIRIYRWDQKASERGEDKPVKQDDDPVDETRYVCSTFIEPRVRK